MDVKGLWWRYPAAVTIQQVEVASNWPKLHGFYLRQLGAPSACSQGWSE